MRRQNARGVSAEADAVRQAAVAASSAGPMRAPNAAEHAHTLGVAAAASRVAQKPPTQAAASPPKAMCRGLRSRRDRRRPVHDIRRLRVEIQELERDLHARWAAANERSRRRLRARESNRELKTKLKLSVERAKALDAQLQAFTGQSPVVETLLPSLGVLANHLAFDKARDAAIFALLARSVDENYLQLGQVFRDSGLQDVSAELKDVQVQATGAQSGVLKLRTVNMVPFDLPTVLGAMWRALEAEATADSDTHTSDMGLSRGLETRTILMKRDLVLRDGLEGLGVGGGTVSCTMRVVLKKFVEPGREVHVWDAFGDWPWAVTTRELGWGVMEPMDPSKKEAAGATKADITLVQNCILLKSATRGLDDTGTRSDVAKEAPRESVVRLYDQIMDARQQAVENALLDQSRER